MSVFLRSSATPLGGEKMVKKEANNNKILEKEQDLESKESQVDVNLRN